MDEILAALADQQAELDRLLAGLDSAGWAAPAPDCPGWTVADVVLHLAQTDELGAASADGRFDSFLAQMWTPGPTTSGAPSEGNGGGGTVDDGAALMVQRERGRPGPEVRRRWQAAAEAERAALARRSPADRVQWVAGDMAARTLATTRLSETWIHANDVAAAVGVALAPTGRLWHIARLAWRTLPYAFARAGETFVGPVDVTLTAPDGDTWRFGGATPAPTQVDGEALEFCLVAGQRRRPAETGLRATGPEAQNVLALVRTYA